MTNQLEEKDQSCKNQEDEIIFLIKELEDILKNHEEAKNTTAGIKGQIVEERKIEKSLTRKLRGKDEIVNNKNWVLFL